MTKHITGEYAAASVNFWDNDSKQNKHKEGLSQIQKNIMMSMQ